MAKRLKVLDELGEEFARVARRQQRSRGRLRRGHVLTLAIVLTTSTAAVASDVGGLLSGPAPLVRDAVVAPPPGPGNLGAAHQTSVGALRAHLVGGDPAYLRRTDWDSARSFAIAGTRLRGWTFTQPGKRCLAIPDPIAEGYGVKCATRREIAAGRATVIVLPPTGANAPNIVGALTSEGRTAEIETPSGKRTELGRVGDAYAGTAPTGSRLLVAGRRQSIDPPTSRYVAPADANGASALEQP